MLFGTQSSAPKTKKRKRDVSEMTCYGCGKKGHLRRNCPTHKDKGKDDAAKGNASASTSNPKPKDTAPAAKPSSNAVFTAFVNASIIANTATDSLTEVFYVDSGASAHLVPSVYGLRNYTEFASPLEIAAANNGKIYAYGLGTVRVVSRVDGVDHEAVLEDVYFVPEVHVWLLSLGKLESQGWSVRLANGSMELWDKCGKLFAVVNRVNNVFPSRLTIVAPDTEFAAWMSDGPSEDQVHRDTVKRLDDYALVATAKGGHGEDASLMTWHRRLGHPSFKAVLDLAKSGVSGMTVTDVPAVVPGLDSCAACVAGKAVHLPHKEGRASAISIFA